MPEQRKAHEKQPQHSEANRRISDVNVHKSVVQCRQSVKISFFFCCLRVYVLDELLLEKERVRNLTEEIEQTVQEIQGS